MNRATATAATTAITFGGKKYQLTPLKDADWGAFEKWLQDRQFDVAKRNLEGLPLEAQKDLLRYAHDRATAIGFADPESIKAMNSYEGACFITYLSLRHKHPDITEDEVAELLFSPEALGEAMDKLPMGMPDNLGEPKKKRAGTRTAARKKRKVKRIAANR